MLRFLLTPRWIAGHVLLVAGVLLFVNLGFWQLRRLDEVRTTNALITQRLEAPRSSLEQLLSEVGGDADALAYRRVRTEGRYLADAQVLTAPRSRAGRPGHHVLTPLDTGDEVVLVDRGWIPFEREADLPAVDPVDGAVRVEGILLPAEPGEIGEAELVARIVPEQLEARLELELLPVSLLLQEQSPPQLGQLPMPGEPPLLDEGNHLSYAVQWFLFAVIAVVGYPLLVRRALRDHNERSPDVPEMAAASRP